MRPSGTRLCFSGDYPALETPSYHRMSLPGHDEQAAALMWGRTHFIGPASEAIVVLTFPVEPNSGVSPLPPESFESSG